MKSLSGSFAAALLLACSSGGDGSSSPPPPDGGDNHAQVLGTLGVNTQIGPRTNSRGEAVPAGYNPTLRRRATLMKRAELFVAGTRGQDLDAAVIKDPRVHAFLDWPKDGKTSTATSRGTAYLPSYLDAPDDAWLQNPKAAGAGDVDGDGKEEAVVAYRGPNSGPNSATKPLALIVKVLQRGAGEGYVVLQERTVREYASSEIDQYPEARFWWHNFSVTCGDVDGNGKAETLVTFNGSAFLLGDADADYKTRQTIEYKKAADTFYRILRAAAGDLDDDGRDEFVVVQSLIAKSGYTKQGAYYWILKGVDLAVDALGSVEESQNTPLGCANVAVGDVDGDGVGEVVFAGMFDPSTEYHVLVADRAWDGAARRFAKPVLRKVASLAGRGWYDFTPPTFVADFDGDGKREILAHDRMYRRDATGEFKALTKPGTSTEINLFEPEPNGLPEVLGYAWNASAAIGDVDGDGKVDLAYVTDYYREVYWLGFDRDGAWAGKKRLDVWNDGKYYPIVAAGDFDGDSIVVEFVTSETLFSDPHPVAVLASNPFWSGVAMPGETSIGYLNATGQESESAIGFTTGISIGYESDFAGVWKGSLKTSLESAFDATASEAVEISETHTWIGKDQDTVVFAAIPYDVYYYRVVRSPDAGALGKTLTANVPRKPIVRAVERGFYNANNGSGPDIESATLGGSMVGDPMTYPTSAEADLLIAAGGGAPPCPPPPAQLTPGCAGWLKSATTEFVGQGSVQTKIEMSIENKSGSGTEFNVEVKSEAEVGVGGWTAGVSFGFHYGESYKVYTTNGTIFGGAVGGLPTADNVAAKQFRWGLFSYQTRAGTSPPFVVVQYYVEPVQ